MATTSESNPVVELRDIHRRFGRKRVLRGVDLRVLPATSVVLTGANGAGKTTLLRIVATLLKPSSGSGFVCGHPLSGGDEIRASVGYLSARGTLYDDLSAEENLRFVAQLHGVGGQRQNHGDLLESVGLADAVDQRVRTFSTGMRRRLSLAALRLRPLDLVLMDEPYAGLDTEGMTMVDRMVSDFSTSGTAVLLATHMQGEATRRATASYRIQDGRLVRAETG